MFLLSHTFGRRGLEVSGGWRSMAARLAGRSLYNGMLGRYRVICPRTEIHPEIPIWSRRSKDKDLLSSSQRFGSLQASYPRFYAVQEEESAFNMSLPTPGDLRLQKFVEASECVKKLFGIWISGPESVSGSENVEVFPYLVPGITMTDEEFFEFCHMNSEYPLERTVEGGLLMMSPTGAISSSANAELIGQLFVWSKQDGTGKIFDSNGGFTLPNGAIRSPDAAWIHKSRLECIPLEQQERYPPICPEFLMELRSKTDRLAAVKAKMEMYIENGTALGWLIDPLKKQVYVYQPNKVAQILDSPTTLQGDPILPGFVLDLSEIW